LASSVQETDFPALNNLRRNFLKRDRMDSFYSAGSAARAIIVFLWVINPECTGDYPSERADIFAQSTSTARGSRLNRLNQVAHRFDVCSDPQPNATHAFEYLCKIACCEG
jgi:hypothetical protein